MNLKKQTGFKAKLIEATLRLGRKKLLNQKMTFSEKSMNFIVDILVRKKKFIETYWSYPKAIFHPHNDFIVQSK